MKKKSRLGPLLGGSDKYVSTLQKCLEFVEESNPSEEQLKEWFVKTFRLENERAVKDYTHTIKNLGLIVKDDGKLLLSDTAKRFLETHENSLLYQVLNANYVGFNDALRILYDNALTLSELAPLLRRKIGAKWQKETQCRLRLYWLSSLGYVVKKGRKYTPTIEGKKIVESEMEEKPPKRLRKHTELQDMIFEIGEFNKFFSEREYSIGEKRRLDVVWKRTQDGKPLHVFEIQLNEPLYGALGKLKHAWEIWPGSELRLVTTEKFKKEAKMLLETSFHEMKDTTKIMEVKDIPTWYATEKESYEMKKKYDIRFRMRAKRGRRN